MNSTTRWLVPLAVLVFCATAPAFGQKVEITPFIGYQSGINIDVRQGDLVIPADAEFGLMLSVRTRHDGLVEFLYSRQPTTLTLDGGFSSEFLGDLDMHYFQAGGLWEINDGKSGRAGRNGV